MVNISVQIIAKETTEFGRRIFKSCLESLLGHPAQLIVVDNGCSESVRQMISEVGTKFNIEGTEFVSIIKDRKHFTFSELRNFALEKTRGDTTHYQWVDSDESFFPTQLKKLKEFLSENDDVVQVNQNLVHLMIHPYQYQEKYSKSNVFKYSPSLTWTKGVHEYLQNVPTGKHVNTDYEYLHFGYCRRQFEKFLGWLWYDILEKGNVNGYRESVEEGKVVHYLRDWRTPNGILEDRKPQCKPYEGKYPEACTPWLAEWHKSKLSWEDWLKSLDPEMETFWQWWQDLYKKYGNWKDTLADVCKRMGWSERS